MEARRISTRFASCFGLRSNDWARDVARVYKSPMTAPLPDPLSSAAGTLTLGDMVVCRMGFGARWVTVGDGRYGTDEAVWPT